MAQCGLELLEAPALEVEDALSQLADEDGEFAARLENEYVREENDQFCGLFVKNLENVQGDERDIIRARVGEMLERVGLADRMAVPQKVVPAVAVRAFQAEPLGPILLTLSVKEDDSPIEIDDSYKD